MTAFRFSTNVFTTGSPAAFAATCRRIEAQGYDTLFAADHLGIAAPFPTLVAAAAATERLTVGTLVLNTPFWNPALLAREIATTDQLTGGRLEVGLGAGHMKWEFDAADIPWQPLPARTEQLAATLDHLDRAFAADGFARQADLRAAGEPVLRPVQRHGFGGFGPPLIIGGTGDRVLRLAAERADIVSIAGIHQVKGAEPGILRIGSAAEAKDRVRFARGCAGDRADAVEWHVLVQAVVPADDRRAAAAELAGRYGPALTADDLLDTPFLLIGTVEEMAGQVLRNRERFGFTYYSVQAPSAEAFVPVMDRVRALGG
ncbi:TIGR03621 family F420-dependent LLM class oxidoreductase [Streptomyces sp. NPDC050161]|uniref:TIGR03621 family F420-dependent LLM class oxidoreductase n=1 Tax=Streptomyces sp. NPDC050161 TaxID=3365604 RepID=UPI0037B28624